MGVRFTHHNIVISSLIFAVLSSDKEIVDLDVCMFDNVVAGSEGMVDNVAAIGSELKMVGNPTQRKHMESTV